MMSVNYCVVGGGIVGLATAAALSPHGSVALLESRPRLIEETSSRNSGVVHSGLYYPRDSLKTKLCMEGNANMWTMKERYGDRLEARKIGKWIGSTSAEEDAVLETLIEKLEERHLPYELLSQKSAREQEPNVSMKSIVNCQSTGIVDVHSLAALLQSFIESQNEAFVAVNAPVSAIEKNGRHFAVRVGEVAVSAPHSVTEESYSLQVDRAVISAVGLHGNELWNRIQWDGCPLSQPSSHTLLPCKGRYAGYRGKALVSRLVYPCPLPNLVGLGVHSVVDMAGQVRFGPDAHYTNSFTDYSMFEEEKRSEETFLDTMHEAITRYLPSARRESLFADFSGIRPKLAGPGEGFRDFVIDEVFGPGTNGVANVQGLEASTKEMPDARLVVLSGIESPGLTASTAIASYVAERLISSTSSRALEKTPWATLT